MEAMVNVSTTIDAVNTWWNFPFIGDLILILTAILIGYLGLSYVFHHLHK